MRRLLPVIALLLVVVPAFAAADASGKWSGSFQITRPDGQLSNEKIFMTFAQKDTGVTGTVGPTTESQQTIRNGKLTGDKLTFEMTTPDGAAVTFTLTLADGHLKGEASAEYQGRKMKGVVDATHEK